MAQAFIRLTTPLRPSPATYTTHPRDTGRPWKSLPDPMEQAASIAMNDLPDPGSPNIWLMDCSSIRLSIRYFGAVSFMFFMCSIKGGRSSLTSGANPFFSRHQSFSALLAEFAEPCILSMYGVLQAYEFLCH
jgi:hypothetical protein